MNWETYFALEAVNWSSLKTLADSPADYAYERTHERPDPAAFQLGRLVHAATLEPDTLLTKYTTYDKVRRGEDWKKFKAANSGKEIVTVSDWQKACAIRDAVRAHPLAAALLADGNAEQVITWTDAKTGLKCKMRADFLTEATLTATDLKTARRIDTHSLERAVLDLGYYGQAAFYLRGLKTVTGEDWTWKFIFVTKEPRHKARVSPLTEDALWYGDQEVSRLLTLLATCIESDEWPDQYETESPIDLPGFFYAQQDAESEAYL